MLTPPSREHDVVDVSQHMWKVFSDAYLRCKSILYSGETPVVLGGDRSCSIPGSTRPWDTVSLISRPLESSGVELMPTFTQCTPPPQKTSREWQWPLFCGHTLPLLNVGSPLDPSQFAHVGVRAIDTAERQRLSEYAVPSIDSVANLTAWAYRFDRIHISVDVDCLDPVQLPSVNTPVPGGMRAHELVSLLTHVAPQVLSVDVVGYNPRESHGGGTGTGVLFSVCRVLTSPPASAASAVSYMSSCTRSFLKTTWHNSYCPIEPVTLLVGSFERQQPLHLFASRCMATQHVACQGT